jgi:hypothetical protein
MWCVWGTGEVHTGVFSVRPVKKIPLGRPKRRWEVNIKIDLQEEDEGVDWIDLAHDRDRWWPVVIEVMNFPVP